MATLFRWLLRIFTALIVLLILSVSAIWYLASRSLPDYAGEFQVRGLRAGVEIVRNNAAIPHIFAQSDTDIFYGLGFAHAQDRLWQMTLLRRTAQGRLSELFGERTLKIDETIRRLDLYNLADQSLAAQDDYTKAALAAYSAGVNAWLTEVNREALGRGAPEFFLFTSEIAPWQPTDSLALIKLMALNMSVHLENEVLRARVSLLLPEERLRDIMPDDPGSALAALPAYAAFLPNTNLPPPLPASDLVPTDIALSPFNSQAFAGASNAWAAAPSRSTTGATLLANDPHLGLSAPSIWYLARLELAGGGVIGGTIPGIPAILTGRSDRFGWGLTSSYLDDQDLHLEKLNPENPSQVLTAGGWKDLRERDIVIKVKDHEDVPLRLQWSDNGPILPGSLYNLAAITPEGHAMSLSWTALSPADTSMSAAMALMRADTVEQGLAAVEAYIAPSQNLLLADQEHIALTQIGAMPLRDAANQSQGRLPTPAWLAQNLWTGMLPASAAPRFVDPEGGLLANTNNKTIDRPFPEHLSFLWGDTQRIRRLSGLLEGRQVHTRDSFIEAQLDTVSFAARSLLPLVAGELWFTGEPAVQGTPERLRQDALKLLADWNGEMSEHRPEPLLYSVWLRVLQRRLIEDDLGPLASEFTHIDPVFIERVYRDIDGASRWCDVIQSAAPESCTDIARSSLDEALVWINETMPGTLESLRWGDLHEARHDHSVLGDVPFLGVILNIRQSTSGDDDTLMRGRTLGTGANPFFNVHAAAFRGVYDFADPDSSVFIQSTGQSGHPLSRHYDDLGELWRRGEYVPMSLDPELARAGAVGISHLIPETVE